MFVVSLFNFSRCVFVDSACDHLLGVQCFWAGCVTYIQVNESLRRNDYARTLTFRVCTAYFAFILRLVPYMRTCMGLCRVRLREMREILIFGLGPHAPPRETLDVDLNIWRFGKASLKSSRVTGRTPGGVATAPDRMNPCPKRFLSLGRTSSPVTTPFTLEPKSAVGWSYTILPTFLYPFHDFSGVEPRRCVREILSRHPFRVSLGIRLSPTLRCLWLRIQPEPLFLIQWI